MRNKLFFLVLLSLFTGCEYSQFIQSGNKYKTIKSMYLFAEYKIGYNKKVSKKTAIAYFESKCRAKRRFTKFQKKVPVGTIKTIENRAPKPWYLYFQRDRYFVKLSPDLSEGLDIQIQLDSGIDGDLDGLNPELFLKKHEE